MSECSIMALNFACFDLERAFSAGRPSMVDLLWQTSSGKTLGSPRIKDKGNGNVMTKFIALD